MNVHNQQSLVQKHYTDNKSVQKKNAVEYLEKRKTQLRSRNENQQVTSTAIQEPNTQNFKKGTVIDTYV